MYKICKAVCCSVSRRRVRVDVRGLELELPRGRWEPGLVARTECLLNALLGAAAYSHVDERLFFLLS